MSYESAFYNKYAHLTPHSPRDLLKTLLALHTHTKHIDAISSQINEDTLPENPNMTYGLVCKIQEDFLSKRELLCNANEQICEVIRGFKQSTENAYNSHVNSCSVDSTLLTRIKSQKYHFEQITEEHKQILQKQDDRLITTIDKINTLKTTISKQMSEPSIALLQKK